MSAVKLNQSLKKLLRITMLYVTYTKKGVRGLHPLLYKSLLVSTLSFLILALIVMPFLRRGEPEFYANILGILLLLLFIVAITILQHREARKEKIKYSQEKN